MAARLAGASIQMGWSIRRLAALCLLALALATGIAGARAQPQPASPPAGASAAPVDPKSPRGRLDSVRLELSQIEATLSRSDLSDDELQRQRIRLQPPLDQLRLIIDQQTPLVEQAKLKLDQLGTKPDDKAPPESAEIARERELRTKAYADADETLKIARASLLQAEQLQSTIGDKRREIFATTLFAAGPSVLSPDVWSNAVTTAPEDLRASGYVFGGWLSGVSAAFSGARGGVLGLALIGAVLLYWLRARYLPRFKARYANTQDTGSLHCLYV
ncbi:MAG: DUF3772 domain-containing protein, partial [Bosea sp. (in: a-proteobacteria)]|nr:DUF3772 domain-containing protein [Bosea sp. (in: a-proteobacteria)]